MKYKLQRYYKKIYYHLPLVVSVVPWPFSRLALRKILLFILSSLIQSSPFFLPLTHIFFGFSWTKGGLNLRLSIYVTPWRFLLSYLGSFIVRTLDLVRVIPPDDGRDLDGWLNRMAETVGVEVEGWWSGSLVLISSFLSASFLSSSTSLVSCLTESTSSLIYSIVRENSFLSSRNCFSVSICC